jgi:hypothetical protein
MRAALFALLFAGSALAQVKKPDAGAPPPVADAGAAIVDAAPPPVIVDAAAVPPPPPPGDAGKLSPLNPLPQEFPDGGAPPASIDFDKLLADIAALRARVAAVSDNLYTSRIQVALETSGDHGRIGKLTVSLDDGIVYTAPPSFRASDMTTVYEHAVAPGRHSLTVDVDRRDDRNDSFRTSQRTRFAIEVPRDNRLEMEIRIWDDSTMGDDFPGDRSGRYELKVRAKAVAKPVKR